MFKKEFSLLYQTENIKLSFNTTTEKKNEGSDKYPRKDVLSTNWIAKLELFSIKIICSMNNFNTNIHVIRSSNIALMCGH